MPVLIPHVLFCIHENSHIFRMRILIYLSLELKQNTLQKFTFSEIKDCFANSKLQQFNIFFSLLLFLAKSRWTFWEHKETVHIWLSILVGKNKLSLIIYLLQIIKTITMIFPSLLESVYYYIKTVGLRLLSQNVLF